MSQYSRVALLVVMLVGALSMPFVSIFGLQFAASFQAAAGLAIPAVCALMSGGCQWTAAVASGLFAHVQSNGSSFAAILGDGSVVTWGDIDFGGDNSSVRDQLKNVQQIQAGWYAFAAILRAEYGGYSSAVQDQLTNAQEIQATRSAFAAILDDGSVVTWGNARSGGDSTAVQAQLQNVQQIRASEHAFAAILSDRSVVTWGMACAGGDSRALQDRRKNVQQIQASGDAFAAITGDGSVVTWGDVVDGGDSAAVQAQLNNVQQVQSTTTSFAAVLGDGSVVTWGLAQHGGDSTAVQAQLQNVQQVQANVEAFAAIVDDVTWGSARAGGDSSAVPDELNNVQQIQSSEYAFAAILSGGSVMTWGHPDYGGDSSAAQHQLENVQTPLPSANLKHELRGFLVCAVLRGKSSDRDEEDAETARRSPMRSPADEQMQPQSYGAEEVAANTGTAAASIGVERWQWNERYGMPWRDFTADVAMELSEAQSRGETLIELNIRGNRYEINLETFQQKNLSTGRTRAIRKFSTVQSELM
eukprot:s927_g11.t2